MDEYESRVELDGSVTVVLGYDERPKSPQPLSSPCPAKHVITSLIKESEKSVMERDKEVIVVRSVHNCTPLSAAVIMKRNDKVRNMLEEGIPSELLHQQDCSGSPVLCGAAYHDNLDGAKMLLKYGAPVNGVTKHGLTPLCIASGSGSVGMVRLLLACNGDINLRAVDGTSPIHVAAERGQIRNLNVLLDERHLDPNLVLEPYQNRDVYCPSALILAAVNGRHQVLDILIQHFDLSPKANCDLLLTKWARDCLSKVCQGKSCNDESLRLGLKIRQNKGIHISCTSPIYGTTIEVTTYEEFEDTVRREGLFGRICQALTVLCRTVGLSNKTVISECLVPCAKTLAEKGLCGEAEMLLSRALEWMPLTEIQMSEHGVDMMPSHLHVTLGLSMPHLCSILCTASRKGHRVQWLPIVNSIDAILNTLLRLMARQSCQDMEHWNEAYRRDLLFLLSMLSCALTSDNNLPRDLVESVVSKYTQYVCGRFTSPLHLALHGASYIVRTLRLCGHRNSIAPYVLLIERLMACLPCIINVPYRQFFCKGERPIHMAARLAESDPCYSPVLDCLLAEGAHFDALTTRGVSMHSIVTRDALRACYCVTLKPLSCLAAMSVVQHDLDYRNSSYLPSKIKAFIGYHDCKSSFCNNLTG